MSRLSSSTAPTCSSPTSVPDALERIGLDYEALAARNPRLIYAIVTGYGLEGPDADRAAYDIAAFWARSGIASLLDAPERRPAVPTWRHGRSQRRT